MWWSEQSRSSGGHENNAEFNPLPGYRTLDLCDIEPGQNTGESTIADSRDDTKRKSHWQERDAAEFIVTSPFQSGPS